MADLTNNLLKLVGTGKGIGIRRVLATVISDNGLGNITVTLAGSTTKMNFMNKTGEVISVGDTVYIEYSDNNINTGYIVMRMGTPVFPSADIPIKKGDGYLSIIANDLETSTSNGRYGFIGSSQECSIDYNISNATIFSSYGSNISKYNGFYANSNYNSILSSVSSDIYTGLCCGILYSQDVYLSPTYESGSYIRSKYSAALCSISGNLIKSTACIVSGSYCGSQGTNNFATGNYSWTNANNSFTTGDHNNSNGDNQIICGKYSDNNNASLKFLVGIGTDNTHRKNGFSVDESGNVIVAGNLQVAGSVSGILDINNQAPTFTEDSTLTNITSGEKLSILFGRIKKAISILISHIGATGSAHGVATTGTSGVNGFMSSADKTKLDGIATGAEVNVQADWNMAVTTDDSYIKNKPTSMPASDVPAWAKAATKPTYSASEVGLGNVENKSSATIRSEISSTNVTTALGYTPENAANKGVANGYCPLDSGGKVAVQNLPSTLLKYVGTWNPVTNVPTLTNPDTSKCGYVYIASAEGTRFGYTFKIGDWLIYNSSGVPEKSDNSDDVVSVNGKTGIVVLSAADVGALPLNANFVTSGSMETSSNIIIGNNRVLYIRDSSNTSRAMVAMDTANKVRIATGAQADVDIGSTAGIMNLLASSNANVKVNGNSIYHAGNKPTLTDLGYTFDTTPASGSNNLISSGVVASALDSFLPLAAGTSKHLSGRLYTDSGITIANGQRLFAYDSTGTERTVAYWKTDNTAELFTGGSLTSLVAGNSANLALFNILTKTNDALKVNGNSVLNTATHNYKTGSFDITGVTGGGYTNEYDITLTFTPSIVYIHEYDGAGNLMPVKALDQSKIGTNKFTVGNPTGKTIYNYGSYYYTALK